MKLAHEGIPLFDGERIISEQGEEILVSNKEEYLNNYTHHLF